MSYAHSKRSCLLRSGSAAVALITVVLIGCASDELTGTLAPNLPPTVWISIAPPESSTVDYRARVFWGGYDPDGKISHFEYAIADNETGVFLPADTTGGDKWHLTEARDSVFHFSADTIADSAQIDFDEMRTYEFVRSHTFFVRSVDEDGARSKPVYRSFTARNLSPILVIESPRTAGRTIALVPPVITFTWTARDFIAEHDQTQPPDSVRSILLETDDFNGNVDDAVKHIRENPHAPEWTEWIAYDAPDGRGRFWRPDKPLSYGRYVFAAQAKDEAGAVSPVFDYDENIRIISVTERLNGPALIVRNEYLGIATSSVLDAPPNILNLPAGVPVTFTWTADASDYGGLVSGYRYGWDILDLNDEDHWEISYTPFVGSSAQSPPRTFSSGTHTFYVEVSDNTGYKSRLRVRLNIVPYTMERPLLVVDDWKEQDWEAFFATRGAAPSDKEHDAFWADVLSDIHGFDPDVDMIPAAGLLEEVPITLLTKYKAIIWNTRAVPLTNTTTAIIDDWVEWGASRTNFLTLFMAVGGKVLLCGDHVMAMTIDRDLFRFVKPRYPFIFRYEIDGDQTLPLAGQDVGVSGVGEASFAYKECCLNVMDVCYTAPPVRPRSYCKVNDVRSHSTKDEGLRVCLPIDETYTFPRLELRPEVSSYGRAFNEDWQGLSASIFNPPYFETLCNEYAELAPRRDCFQPIYGLGCLDESAPVYGAPVAYWTSTFAHVPGPTGVAARSAIWGFTPVYFNPNQVREALNIILIDEWKLND